MAGNQKGQGIHHDLRIQSIGELRTQLLRELLRLVPVVRVGNGHIAVPSFRILVLSLQVRLQTGHNGLLHLLGGAHLGIGVQLAALHNGEHRLDVQKCADGCCHRCDSAALFQVLQGIHPDVNAVGRRIPVQDIADFLRAKALFCQLLRENALLPLYHGNAPAVRHKDLSLIFVILGQHDGCLGAAGKTGGQRHMHHGIIFLQQLVPGLHDVLRRGLGGGHITVCLQLFEELLPAQIDTLEIFRAVNPEGHGHHPNAQLPALLLGDAGAGIS